MKRWRMLEKTLHWFDRSLAIPDKQHCLERLRLLEAGVGVLNQMLTMTCHWHHWTLMTSKGSAGGVGSGESQRMTILAH